MPIQHRAPRRNSHTSPNNAAERASPLVRIAQLTPAYYGVPNKVIREDGRIEDYPNEIVDWTWKLITIRAPFDIFDLVRFNAGNSILIRGTPQDTTLSITRKKKASDKYPTGFIDAPTAWIAFDVDGAPLPSGVSWLTDPDAAVRSVIACLGEAFRDVTVVWQFTGTHGLKKDASGKKWTGELISNSVRVRLYFLLDREITCEQAVNWVRILKGSLPQLDEAILRQVQPNYILPPHFEGGSDPIPQRVGIIRGSKDRVHVPDNLDQQTRWAHAEGIGRVEVAEHPDLHAAIAAVGTPLPGRDHGTIYPHLLAAAQHLLRQNPRAPATPIPVYAVEMTAAFERIVRSDRHMAVIATDLLRHNRKKSDVLECFQPTTTTNRYIGRWIEWLVEHPNGLHLRKRVRRGKALRRHRLRETAAAIFEQDPDRWSGPQDHWRRQVHGAAAASHRTRHGKRRRRSGDRRGAAPRAERRASREAARGISEQWAAIRGLARAAGRRPAARRQKDVPAPRGSKAAAAIETGRGKIAVPAGRDALPAVRAMRLAAAKAPADIWFVAHESLMHQKPAVLGKVVELLLDEDPLDAFTPDPEEIGFEEFGRESTITDDADRRADTAFPPCHAGAEADLGAAGAAACAGRPADGPVPKAALLDFVNPPRRGGQGGLGWDPGKQIRREWREKVGADITPAMAREEVEAAALGRAATRCWTSG